MIKLLKRFLCKIDIHRWEDVHQCEWTGWTQDVEQQCAWCGKRQSISFFSPLSGLRPPIQSKDR